MVWKYRDEESRYLGDYYCDVQGCDQKAVKALWISARGFWAGFFGRQYDKFDVCWKHYLENLQQFKEVSESMKK